MSHNTRHGARVRARAVNTQAKGPGRHTTTVDGYTRKTERRTYFGTGVSGIGAAVRHASLSTSAGTVAGTTMPGPSTALEMATTNFGLD